MRVLVAHTFYREPGGEDRYVEQQLQLLAGRHVVELVGARNEDLSRVEAARTMVGSRRVREQIDRTIERFRPDVVHLHNAYPALGPAVHKGARAAGVPLVMTVHNFRMRCPNGYMFTHGENCRRCENGAYVNAVIHRCLASRSQSAAYAASLWLHRFVLKTEADIARFITPSRFMHDTMLEWGFEATRLQVVRNFVPDPPARRPLGDHGLYLGRLSPEKGLDVLVRALQVAGDPPFSVVGDGPERTRLESLATALGLRRTEFRGRLDRGAVDEVVAGSRYLVLPSLWNENAPLAALEAMAAGRPLVVARIGGLAELVDGGGGIEFPAGDVERLAAAIRTFHDDRGSGERGGARARSFFETHCTSAKHLAGLEEAYDAAVAAGAAPAHLA
jgi:glycosyltransferase involved in cell wall biosynthesis